MVITQQTSFMDYKPLWWVFLFGGNYYAESSGSYYSRGSGWHPGLVSRTKRYLEQENWRGRPYTWWDFVKIGGPKNHRYFVND